MVSVQSDGCCPISLAFEKGERFAAPFVKASTSASGLRVPVAVGDFMILDAVRESNGIAIAVSEGEIGRWQAMATQAEGVSVCPETAACVGAVKKLAGEGWIHREEHVVVFNTGAAQKYVSSTPPPLPRIEANVAVDWPTLLAAVAG
jgi:threonine synthase